MGRAADIRGHRLADLGGYAGLVNGLDPHLVVVGGFGLHIAADEVTAAYHDGLMAFRAIPPPPIVPARLGPDAPLLGAADEAFALLLTDARACGPGLPGCCESGRLTAGGTAPRQAKASRSNGTSSRSWRKRRRRSAGVASRVASRQARVIRA